MVGQVDHLVGVFFGFMNDGQVEKPEKKRGEEKKISFKCLFKTFKKKKKSGEGNSSSRSTEEKSLITGAFRNIGLLLGYFHHLWFDTSDALSVPGRRPGTFLNSPSAFKLRPGRAHARS